MSLISSMKSMTHAQKAKRILWNAGVRCNIIGIDRSLTRHGCAYGIEYSEYDARLVQRLLAEASLDYGDVLGR